MEVHNEAAILFRLVVMNLNISASTSNANGGCYSVSNRNCDVGPGN